MPISRNYTAGSIVYFQGDVADDIYVLQKGRVILLSTALDSGEEQREEVQLGEFFGVKSSLGRYRREETAQVIGNTTLIVFKPAEFEGFVLKNTRLIMKMLKVFSKQLRNIHRQVREILKVAAPRDNAFELVNVAESFHKSGNLDHAIYAYQKYLEYYPDEPYKSRVQDLLQYARRGQNFPINYAPLVAIQNTAKPVTSSHRPAGIQQSHSSIDDFSPNFDDDFPEADALTDVYNQGIQKANAEQFQQALDLFTKCLSFSNFNSKDEQDLFAAAHYQKGYCEFKLKEFDAADKSLSIYIKKFPTSGHIRETLYHLGMIAEVRGIKDRARSLYAKVATMAPPSDITKEAKKRLEKLG